MDKDTIKKRRDRILKIVVNSYIDTASPVGSKAIYRKYHLGISPATIRNIMSDLEEEGYLMHPHTSAGRVPTDKGYRVYVDTLMEPEQIGDYERRLIEQNARAQEVEDTFEKISRVLSHLTGQVSVMFTPKHRFYFDGTSNILAQPEFKDIDKLRAVIRAFEDREKLLDIMQENMENPEDVSIHIGEENHCSELCQCSIITSCYKIKGRPAGSFGVLGPTRMDYPKVVSMVDYVSDFLSDHLENLL